MRPPHPLQTSRRALGLAVVLALAGGAAAQDVPVGSCVRGTAAATLDTPRLSVPLFTDGRLFGADLADRPDGPRYLVPRAEGAAVASSAWLLATGYLDGSLRGSTRIEGPGDFWPGPLVDAEAPPDDCAAFDRIWTVSRADVERYLRTGEATADLAEWPADLGAPVIDGDGIDGNYDLAAGDQPDLLGDVAAWWVMNDAGNAHGRGPADVVTAPLGVEVRTHAFAFVGSPVPGLSPLILRDASFLRVEVVNRRAVPIDSLRLSLFGDMDIGYPYDNFVGTDTLANLSYAYNGDPVDDGAYGDHPPAWGIQVLKGPEGLPNRRDDDFDGLVDEPGERLGMTTAPPIINAAAYYPTSPAEVLNLQRGRVPGGPYAGQYLRQCSYGHPFDVWAYPGDPWAADGWIRGCTEFDRWPYEDLAGSPWFRAKAVTVGATTVPPGESAVYVFAMPYARSDLPSVYHRYRHSTALLREVAASFQTAFGDGFASRPVPRPRVRLPDAQTLARVRPNPGTGGQRAVLALPDRAHVEATVVDALGRVVAVVASDMLPAGETALAIPDGLPPGAYVLRVAVDRGAPVAVPITVAR